VKETWRDVPGYQGYYQISNLKRIKSQTREITYKLFNSNKVCTRLLKESIIFYDTTKRLPSVKLSKNSVSTCFYVDDLFAQAFPELV
jgi:hypothetical protein